MYLVPNVNPDGAFHGHLRTNASGKDLNRAWQDSTEALSPEVSFIRQQMEKYGVDMFLDVHGDEKIPYVFTAACEGNPGYTAQQRQLEERFRSRLCEVSDNFQTVHGYPRGAPGQANMNLAANAVGERYKCLSLTLEMPFKDHDNAPDPVTGWSGKRSAQLAGEILTVLSEMVKSFAKSAATFRQTEMPTYAWAFLFALATRRTIRLASAISASVITTAP